MGYQPPSPNFLQYTGDQNEMKECPGAISRLPIVYSVWTRRLPLSEPDPLFLLSCLSQKPCTAPLCTTSAVGRKSRVAGTWLIEIVSIILSPTSLLAILILLARYNGRLLFSWHRLTLNTVISIFATISRISLIVAVSSGMGQWTLDLVLRVISSFDGL
jgi:hypothetical protein